MKKQVRRNKGIDKEMVVALMLNAFVAGVVITKIAICGTSWISTIRIFRIEKR